MDRVYYLNRNQYHKGDTYEAFVKAVEILKTDTDINVITFLVYQQQHIPSFLSDLGFNPQQIRNKNFMIEGYSVQIRTVKTYTPTHVFAGQNPSEMLIAVGVPSKCFDEFVDRSNIKYWIIVPWLLEENLSWLKIHEAEDIETGETLQFELTLDQRIIDAIEWLKETSYPNEGMVHHSDSDRLKSVANEIKRKNIPFNADAVIHYCINNGIFEAPARKIADVFLQARARMLKASNCYVINEE